MTKHDPDTIYDRLIGTLVADLHRRRAGHDAPREGSVFPAFRLPDERGVLCDLSQVLARGPVVISFIRGQWCPYCQEELASWKNAIPALQAAGTTLICITPETGGAAKAIRSSVSPEFTLLCDVDHGLSLSLGLAFHLGRAFIDQYKADGVDLAAIYGSAAGILPIPATFALDRDGVVRAAHVEPDFRIRAKPDDMIRALAVPAKG